MWDNIRWRMRGVHPSNPAYRKMEKSLLDAWAADKQMWLNNRANYKGMRSNMRKRDEYEMPKREETGGEEATFSIRDLRGMMVEAVEYNADLASRRGEEEEERKRNSERRERFRREEREEEERRAAMTAEEREKEDRDKKVA